jgi:hypothetical protein
MFPYYAWFRALLIVRIVTGEDPYSDAFFSFFPFFAYSCNFQSCNSE